MSDTSGVECPRCKFSGLYIAFTCGACDQPHCDVLCRSCGYRFAANVAEDGSLKVFEQAKPQPSNN